jgi:hypothetical protein
MKQLCTDWQLKGRPSDCVARLGSLHVRLLPILHELSAAEPWFSRYPRAFEAAWNSLAAGDLDAFTKPLSSSYHDTWMELHQDLLLAIGRCRDATDGY